MGDRRQDHIDRELRQTWPIVEDCLHVNVVKRYRRTRGAGCEFTIESLIPDAFLRNPEGLTNEECEAMAKALTRTLRREYRKAWYRRVIAEGDRRAEAARG